LYPHAESYTILDHLINCFQIEIFQKIFKKITNNLEYIYDDIPRGANITISSNRRTNTSNLNRTANNVPQNGEHQRIETRPMSQRGVRIKHQVSQNSQEFQRILKV
jgi:hypothetical protein